jgi:hypothetical protein
MTRSHKFTDRVYGDAALEQEAHGNNLPKFFGKNTGFDTDPKKTKKDGGGKGNWLVFHHCALNITHPGHAPSQHHIVCPLTPNQ